MVYFAEKAWGRVASEKVWVLPCFNQLICVWAISVIFQVPQPYETFCYDFSVNPHHDSLR